MAKKGNRWLQRQDKDNYVKEAKKLGYRSRAAFKLLEIQERDHIFKHGARVVDLGAAPGGWSQVASHLVGVHGQVIALDILDMDQLPDVTFIRGDFREADVEAALQNEVGDKPIDIVMSDMAPNMSGERSVDQPRAIYLIELALDFAQKNLKPGGFLLVKAFQGEGFDLYLKNMREAFDKVVVRKPPASRRESREVYLLGKGFKSTSDRS